MPSASFYECTYGTCRKRSRTEGEARAHYQAHITGTAGGFGGNTAIVPSRGAPPAKRESRLDRVIRGIDSGSAKIRGGIEGVGKVQDAVNRNFNFEAALGGGDISGNLLTGDFGSFGAGFDLGSAEAGYGSKDDQGFTKHSGHRKKRSASRKPKSITINFG